MLRLATAATALAFACSAAFGAGGDADGGKDFPGLGRFAGSVITGYDLKDFDAAVIQAKPFKDGRTVDARRLEGKTSRIAYRTSGGASILEVFRNYTNKAKAAGFEELLDCETDACGGLAFANDVDVLPLPKMWLDGFNYRYFSARKPAGASNAETYVSVATSENNGDIYTQVIVVELGAIEDKMIAAAEMAKGLAAAGHITLYGIYFDTGKAEVRADSAPTLAEIAKLLNGDPQLKTVYIVGHTDSQGGLDFNMDLSKRRAAAIAAELTGKHAIPAARLKTAGVGFLAPVASNANEAGRALNRRTELVLP